MRERWARSLAFLTCLLVVLLTGVFAGVRNTVAAPEPPDAEGAITAAAVTPTSSEPALDPARVALGREVYVELNCSRCHAIAGEGSPRSPLDGVGARLDREQLRAWTFGDDSVEDDLSPGQLRTKRGYLTQPPDRLDALITYLQSLRD